MARVICWILISPFVLVFSLILLPVGLMVLLTASIFSVGIYAFTGAWENPFLLIDDWGN